MQGGLHPPERLGQPPALTELSRLKSEAVWGPPPTGAQGERAEMAPWLEPMAALPGEEGADEAWQARMEGELPSLPLLAAPPPSLPLSRSLPGSFA